MDRKRPGPINVGTTGILATAVFLLAWSFVERIAGAEPKSASAGTTYHAASQAGATVTPSERPSTLDE